MDWKKDLNQPLELATPEERAQATKIADMIWEIIERKENTQIVIQAFAEVLSDIADEHFAVEPSIESLDSICEFTDLEKKSHTTRIEISAKKIMLK